MNTPRHTRHGLRRLMALIGVATLLGISLSAPAYAAKPADPGGAASSGASAQKSTGKSTGKPATTKDTSSRGSSDHSQGNAGTSGSYDEPQPASNADQNGTGANDTSAGNQYASTRDGSASQNGRGDGKASGKPCAGCVGKADNKNPPGQAPNGSDANAGYECDRNQGIGKTNPAHTGCTTSTPPAPPTVCTVDQDATQPGVQCEPPTPPVCTEDLDASTPGVQCSGGGTSSGECVENPLTTVEECAEGGVSPAEASLAAGSAVSPAAATLPQTGSQTGTAWTVALALLMLTAGATLVARIRKV